MNRTTVGMPLSLANKQTNEQTNNNDDGMDEESTSGCVGEYYYQILGRMSLD